MILGSIREGTYYICYSGVKLFSIFLPMWSQYLNVTEDRRLTVLCVRSRGKNRTRRGSLQRSPRTLAGFKEIKGYSGKALSTLEIILAEFGDYSRRKQRQFVAEFGDCRRFRWQSRFSAATVAEFSDSSRQIQPQSPLSVTVAEFGDCRRKRRLSPNSATVVASVDRA